MNSETNQLRDQLEKFTIDPPGVVLTFTQRLAREQRWTASFAARVVFEYRRFLYLAIRAGHPVTPSDAVDQAWHLHLVYTESYWHDLCRDILRQPLHHGPTRGGRAEGVKFNEWYERTLLSYRQHFGTPPPSDIWPAATERFGEAPFFQRVNVQRSWIFPKPAWLSGPSRRRGLRNEGGWLPADSWAAASLRPKVWGVGGAAGALVCVVGCAARGSNSWNVFDWFGPPFLGFFAGLSAILLAVAGVRRFRLVHPKTAETGSLQPLLTDPYAISFLAGGLDPATQAAVVTLGERGLIQLTNDRPAQVVATGALVPKSLPPFERAVLAKLTGPVNAADLVGRLTAEGDRFECELAADHLLINRKQRQGFRVLGLALAGVALLIGLTKIGVGISRDRPVGFLVFLLLSVVSLLLWWTWRLPRMTAAGEWMLARLRAKHRSVSFDSLRTLRTDAVIPAVSGESALALLPVAVGLYGLGALGADSSALSYHNLLPPGARLTRRDGKGAAGDGANSPSSGCGSGDSGGGSSGDSGGGGGDGGSGCGGCGGGGGD